MIVSIHQPAYLPWLGYFDKIARSDVFVYLDTVQFQKGSFQNRNKLRTAQGWNWMTVPVETKGKLYETVLKDIEIKPGHPWRRKHINAIEQGYARAPHFDAVMEWLAPLYAREWTRLSDLCFEMLGPMLTAMQINTKIVKASQLGDVDAAKSDLVLEICRRLDASQYLSGAVGRDYLDIGSFEEAGIDLNFQEFDHPVYKQLHEPFEPYMGSVDFLMCCDEPSTLVGKHEHQKH